jgi:hypothetical protein
MPDQLLTYSIENPLVIISINSLSLGVVMVIRLVKVALKKGGAEKGVSGLRSMGALWSLCVWVYFCCSGGCLCQGLQGAELVCNW